MPHKITHNINSNSIQQQPIAQRFTTNLLTLGTATLGSSCCLVQLLLNFLGFGCAGFAVLTPYQPIFASLTLGCLGYSLHKNRTSSTLSIAASALLILLSPYIVAQLNLSGISPGREYITCEVQGAKCTGCLNNVKNRLSALPNVTGVSVQFQNESSEVKIGDVAISASYPIPERLLQEALKTEHKLKVVSRVTVTSEMNLPSHLMHMWVVTYTSEPVFGDEAAIALSQSYAALPHVLHVSAFYKERQHTLVTSSSFDPKLINGTASKSSLTIDSIHKK